MKKILTKIQYKETVPLILNFFQKLKFPSISDQVKKRLAITISSLGIITAYYIENYYKNENQFYFNSENPFNNKIESNIEEFKSKYYKTPYFFSRCVSMFYGNIVDNLDLSYNREIIHDKKGENFALDWVDSQKNNKNTKQPIVIVVPGITGDSSLPYVK